MEAGVSCPVSAETPSWVFYCLGGLFLLYIIMFIILFLQKKGEESDQIPQRSQRSPLAEGSVIDMFQGTDPPDAKIFTMDKWNKLRDGLLAAGLNQTDRRQKLYRAACAMNLAQENYGYQMSMVALHGGRLFTERIVNYLLDCEPSNETDVLHSRIRYIQ